MNAKTALSAIAATSLALLLAACGNKGPLVMPQKPVPVEVPATEPAAPAVPADDLPSPPPVDTPVDDGAADPEDPAYMPDDGDG